MPAEVQAPVLEVRSVWKSFGAASVLRGVNLCVSAGEVVALLGRSGSGKSTLLRCIAHLELVDAGTISLEGEVIGYRVDGDRLVPRPERQLAPRRGDIGMVFQHFHLFPHMTVLDNVAFAPTATRKLSRTAAVARANELLAKVGLTDKVKAYPGQLSGGQQQRVAIARALAMRPKLMLFDEPTSALDPDLVHDVLEVMQTLVAEGMTMIVVTHELGFARRAADTIAYMDEGEVAEIAAPDVFFTAPRSSAARTYLSRRL